MKIDEIFPRKYASGEDLAGKPVTLEIRAIIPETMRPATNAQPVEKWVVYFEKAQKGIILSRTLANQIVDATGQEDTVNWIGKRVTLYPLPMRVAGRDVIAIRARKPAAANGHADPPASLQDEEEV